MMTEEMTNLEQAAASDQTEPAAEVVQVIEIVDLDRPLMTTSFEDYTVTEGLLLLLLLFLFVKEFILKPLKGVFSWLSW